MPSLRLPRAALLTLVALTVAVAHPSLARAQGLSEGRAPRDVSLEIIDRHYTIGGNTVEELGLQMNAAASAGRLTSYGYFFRWTFTGRELTGAFSNMRAGRCRIDALDVRFQVDAIYPVWDRGPDAPVELVEAWEAFNEQLVLQWEERREGIFTFGREVSRQLRRLEEDCPLLQVRVQEVVERLQDQTSDAAIAAAAAGERVILRWPPER